MYPCTISRIYGDNSWILDFQMIHTLPTVFEIGYSLNIFSHGSSVFIGKPSSVRPENEGFRHTHHARHDSLEPRPAVRLAVFARRNDLQETVHQSGTPSVLRRSDHGAQVARSTGVDHAGRDQQS